MSKRLFYKYCALIMIVCFSSVITVKAQRNIYNTKNLSFEYGFINHNAFSMFFNDRLEYRSGIHIEYLNNNRNVWTVGVSADQKWNLINNINRYDRFYTAEIGYGQNLMIRYNESCWLKPNLGISLGLRDRLSKLSFVYGLLLSLDFRLFINDNLALFTRPQVKYFFEIKTIQLPITFGLIILDI